MIPISLYVHIPWCVKKCPYCDFNSHAINSTLPEAEYVQALIKDLEQDLHNIQNREIISIFFGGGTPSLFSPIAFEKILDNINRLSKLSSHIEITMEANPGTMEHKHFKDYRLAGINRVSLGVQSFNNEKLERLGRIHRIHEIENAIISLHNADLDSFNLDLMYGLPDQTYEEALQDLNTAISFSPPHLSWYNLTLEPNTVFYSRPPRLPSHDIIFEVQQAGIQLLDNSALEQYEISAFAKSDHVCRHNLNYWEFGDYLGIGAGAHSKITEFQNSKIVAVHRFAKKRMPSSYLQDMKDFQENVVVDKKVLSSDDLGFEFMLNALRLKEGFRIELFEQRTGLSISDIENFLFKAIDKNLLIVTPDIIKPTEQGRLFLNDLLEMILP